MRAKIIIIINLLLILSLFPVAAFAAAPADVKVNVRNQTSGVVQLSLTDANGNISFKTLEPGTSTFVITEGIYTYYASTPCGALAGEWNLNVNKTLYLGCRQGQPGASLQKLINRRSFCNLGYYEHFVDGSSRVDNFVSWTNQSDMILAEASWLNGSPITTLEGAVNLYNTAHNGEAEYSIGCYDNHTNVVWIGP